MRPQMWAAVAATLCLAMGHASGQEQAKGSGRYLVVKSRLDDFSHKSDQVVARFASPEKAEADAAERNSKEKEWTKYIYTAPKPDDDDSPAPTEAAGTRKQATAAAARPIVVMVYKWDGQQWAPQRDQRYITNDHVKASDYFNKVNATTGWKATWNAPGRPAPLVDKPELPVVDVKPEQKGQTKKDSGKTTFSYDEKAKKSPEVGRPADTKKDGADAPNDKLRKRIIGTWAYHEGLFDHVEIYNPDGTALSKLISDGKVLHTNRFRWKVENGNFFIETIWTVTVSTIALI